MHVSCSYQELKSQIVRSGSLAVLHLSEMGERGYFVVKKDEKDKNSLFFVDGNTII